MKYGIGKNHPLIRVLRSHGYARDEARKIVNAIFDAIKSALLRNEEVVLPIGVFSVKEHTIAPYRSWCWGQPRAVYKKRKYVAFEPSTDWRMYGKP